MASNSGSDSGSESETAPARACSSPVPVNAEDDRDGDDPMNGAIQELPSPPVSPIGSVGSVDFGAWQEDTTWGTATLSSNNFGCVPYCTCPCCDEGICHACPGCNCHNASLARDMSWPSFDDIASNPASPDPSLPSLPDNPESPDPSEDDLAHPGHTQGYRRGP